MPISLLMRSVDAEPSRIVCCWVAIIILGLGMIYEGRADPDSGALVDYRLVDGAISTPLSGQPGDPERGRRLILDRDAGDCTICHAMPLPQRQWHGTIGPPLDGVGSRYTAGELRLRLVDPKAINAETIMPAYYKIEGLYRVHERYHGRPILTAQQIEDAVAYLLTLK